MILFRALVPAIPSSPTLAINKYTQTVDVGQVIREICAMLSEKYSSFGIGETDTFAVSLWSVLSLKLHPVINKIMTKKADPRDAHLIIFWMTTLKES